MLSKRRAATLALSLITALLSIFVIAGCGSGGGSSTGATASSATNENEGGTENAAETEGSGNAAVKAAEAEFAEYAKEQPPIEIPVLPKKPESGKTLTITTCPLPVCKSETEPAKEAAEELGWKVTTIEGALTPQAYQTTMSQVATNPGEMVAISPVLPNSFIKEQLDELKAKEIPIVQMAPAGDNPSPKGPVLAAVTGPPQFAKSGQLMGDAVVNDKKGAAKTVFIWDKALAGFWQPTLDEFKKVVEGAGGSVEVLEVSQEQIGKSIPTAVVSYVQAHPEVEYLAFALSDLATGVPQSLAASGLNEQVKILSRAPQATNIENIANGTEWLTVAEENVSAGYRSIDQLARILQGVELGELENPAGWHQIIDAENAGNYTEGVPTPKGFPEVFQEAWHLK
jgi:hypothetical protein